MGLEWALHYGRGDIKPANAEATVGHMWHSPDA